MLAKVEVFYIGGISLVCESLFDILTKPKSTQKNLIFQPNGWSHSL